MTQTPPIKIPFAIKCDNFDFSSRFTKKEITEYFFRIMHFNIDTLDLQDSQVGANFKSMVATQLVINLALKNLQAYSELKKLKKLAPKSFYQRFEEVQFVYDSEAIQIKNIKLGFSDSESNTLSSHILEDGMSVLEKYWDIRSSAIISYSEVIKEINEQGYLKLWCEVNNKELGRAQKILNIIEEICADSFRIGYISSINPNQQQMQRQTFIKNFHDMMKENFTNLKVEKNMYLARLGTHLYTLGSGDDLTGITMLAIEKNYPSMWAQIEKLRIKGIVEVKTADKEGDKSSGKKYKI